MVESMLDIKALCQKNHYCDLLQLKLTALNLTSNQGDDCKLWKVGICLVVKFNVYEIENWLYHLSKRIVRLYIDFQCMSSGRFTLHTLFHVTKVCKLKKMSKFLWGNL